jgi:hypothetical protein
VVTPAVREGLPPAILSGCREAHDAKEFAAQVIALLHLRPAERRAIAQQADLAALTWARQLRPVLDILEEAARRR